jgi:uncharacterized protein YbjT (DUF2867 family)
VLSRRPSAGTPVGDPENGDGVAEAAAGAEIVVHAASATGAKQGRGDEEQTHNLIAAASGARHLLYVSIVGIDDLPLAYYRRKLACERLVEAAFVPHTIQRATQFHQLLEEWLVSASRLPVIGLPMGMRFQPIAAAEVAARLAEAVDGEPAGRAPDIGGPEVLTVRELLATWRTRHERPRAFNLPVPLPIVRALRQGRNTCPQRAHRGQTWAQYVTS